MAKNIIIASFLGLTVLAILLLWNREENPRVREDPDAILAPRISLEDFTVYKYQGHQVQMTLSSKLAHFVDPNILELYGSVRGIRHDSPKKEYFSAESATVFFSSTGVAQLMENPEIIEAELEDNVNVGMSYNRLLTEFAEYLPMEGLLQSELPVVLKGPTGTYKGQNGFRFFTETELIHIYGPTEGVVQGAVLQID